MRFWLETLTFIESLKIALAFSSCSARSKSNRLVIWESHNLTYHQSVCRVHSVENDKFKRRRCENCLTTLHCARLSHVSLDADNLRRDWHIFWLYWEEITANCRWNGLLGWWKKHESLPRCYVAHSEVSFHFSQCRNILLAFIYSKKYFSASFQVFLCSAFLLRCTYMGWVTSTSCLELFWWGSLWWKCIFPFFTT